LGGGFTTNTFLSDILKFSDVTSLFRAG
jgi:hypothetical protein